MGNRPAYSTTAFSTGCARPPCRRPCPTGYHFQARERPRGSLGLAGRPQARREELLAKAASLMPPRRAGCHVETIGATPAPSAMTRAARHIFLCSPARVVLRVPLPQDLSEGTITMDEASRVPLHSFRLFSIVHI
jgi:hypothetical protein